VLDLARAGVGYQEPDAVATTTAVLRRRGRLELGGEVKVEDRC